MKLDDKVWFRLTHFGLEILTEHARREELMCPGLGVGAKLLKNNDGWYSLPLLDTMQIFGRHCEYARMSPFKGREIKTEWPN